MFGEDAGPKIVESRSAGAVLVFCRFASKLFVGIDIGKARRELGLRPVEGRAEGLAELRAAGGR
jgi:hypothetical protein